MTMEQPDEVTQGAETEKGKFEQFTKLREAIGEYSAEKIAEISKNILKFFVDGSTVLPNSPSGEEWGEVYRNLIHRVSWADVGDGDELNCTLYGLAIKKAMDENPEFNAFIRGYIATVNTSCIDRLSFAQLRAGGEEEINRNDDIFTQEEIMAKFILGEQAKQTLHSMLR